MDAIFGYIRDKDGMSESFKAGDDILWSSETETRFSAGNYEEGTTLEPALDRTLFLPFLYYIFNPDHLF